MLGGAPGNSLRGGGQAKDRGAGEGEMVLRQATAATARDIFTGKRRGVLTTADRLWLGKRQVYHQHLCEGKGVKGGGRQGR